MSTNNKLMPIPFADKAGETYKYSIPNTNDTTYPNKATYENGFPAVTMTDIAAGGIPPFGQDFNGVLNDITTAIRYMQAGNYQLYNSDFATSIGGYSKGAVVLGSDNKLYESTIDSNTNDPISGTGWTLHLNYLPLTGGTITGKTTISYNSPEIDLMAGSNSYVMRIFSAAATAGFAFTGTDNSVKTRIRFTRSTETINIENSKLTIGGASVLTTSGGTVSGNTNFTGKLQQAGNDVITTANVSSLFENKLTDSGYQKLPNGLIIQWQNNFAPSTGNISLPISFPNKGLALVVGNTDRQGSGVDNAYGYIVNNSTVFIALKAQNNTTNQQYKVSYIVIGY